MEKESNTKNDLYYNSNMNSVCYNINLLVKVCLLDDYSGGDQPLSGWIWERFMGRNTYVLPYTWSKV